VQLSVVCDTTGVFAAANWVYSSAKGGSKYEYEKQKSVLRVSATLLLGDAGVGSGMVER
jgi:hypothetical protein